MTSFLGLNEGSQLPNGATLIRWGCVSSDTGQVIVLATWRSEFVTWQANMNDTRTTTWGHYFPFGKFSGSTAVDAMTEALRDYHARLAGLSGGMLRSQIMRNPVAVLAGMAVGTETEELARELQQEIDETMRRLARTVLDGLYRDGILDMEAA